MITVNFASRQRDCPHAKCLQIAVITNLCMSSEGAKMYDKFCIVSDLMRQSTCAMKHLHMRQLVTAVLP